MNIHSVVVINPPSPPGYVSNKDSMGGFGQLYPVGATYFPPTDMPYLISYLQHKGHDVGVIECLGSELNIQALLEELSKLSEPALLVLRTSDPTLAYDISVAEKIKSAFPQHQLSLYGPVVEHKAEQAMDSPAFSYLFLDEPDEAVHQILSGTKPEDVPNIIFRNDRDKWHQTLKSPLNKDLDRLPFPAWDRMPHQAYKIPKSSTSSSDLKFLPMLTSRGCPYGCNYCPYPVSQGLPHRYRTADNVVDEIEWLINNLGVNYILFRDPVFSLNQKRIREICAEIIERGLKFNWKCETRFDCAKRETLEAMAAAGCTGINFGIESSEPDIQLESGRRPIAPEEIIEKIDICRELGIKTFCFFIIGLPGDTNKTILDSIEFSIRIRPDWLQFTAAHPLTGTKLRTWAISRGLIAKEGYNYISAHNVVMGNDNLSKKQIARLLKFAKFLQNNVLNRRGILKNSSRKDFVYRALKSAADHASFMVAKSIFKVGKISLERMS